MGKEIWAIPNSTIYHKNAVTLPMFTRMKQYLNHRNSYLMVLSNYSLPITLYLAPIRFALELVAALYAIVRLDLNHLLGIIQAQLWILFHPHVIIHRRKKVKQVRKIKDKDFQALVLGQCCFGLLHPRQENLSGDYSRVIIFSIP